MKKVIQMAVVAALIASATALQGQENLSSNAEETPQIEETNNAKSFLRIGLNPLNLFQPAFRSVDLDLSYERVLSPRLTLTGTLSSKYHLTSQFNPEVRRVAANGTNVYQDITAALSFDPKYYFKLNTYNGHFVELAVDNLLSYGVTADNEYFFNAFTGTSSVQSMPVIGLYYGYRKQFKSGLFLEGKIGFQPNNQPFRNIDLAGRIAYDGQATIGFLLNRKKK